MKRLGQLVSCVGLLSAGTLGATLAAAGTVQAVKRPLKPTAKEALRSILANGDVPLTATTSCDSVKGPGDKTFADYFSTVLATQADPTITWHTVVSSVALTGAKPRWRVDVKFLGADAGDVYDMGIRFTLDDATRKMDRTSISCIGTS